MAMSQDSSSRASRLATRSRWWARSSAPSGRALGKSISSFIASRNVCPSAGAGSIASSASGVTSTVSSCVSRHPSGRGSTLTLTSKNEPASPRVSNSRGGSHRTHWLRYSRIRLPFWNRWWKTEPSRTGSPPSSSTRITWMFGFSNAFRRRSLITANTSAAGARTSSDAENVRRSVTSRLLLPPRRSRFASAASADPIRPVLDQPSSGRVPFRLLDHRRGEQDAAEEQVRQDQRPDHVEGLGPEEGSGRSTALHGDQLGEAGFQPDAREGQREPDRPEPAQQPLGGAHGRPIQ